MTSPCPPATVLRIKQLCPWWVPTPGETVTLRYRRTPTASCLTRRCAVDQEGDPATRHYHVAGAFLHQAGAGAVDQARHPVPRGDGGAAEALRQGAFFRQHHRILGESNVLTVVLVFCTGTQYWRFWFGLYSLAPRLRVAQ